MPLNYSNKRSRKQRTSTQKFSQLRNNELIRHYTYPRDFSTVVLKSTLKYIPRVLTFPTPFHFYASIFPLYVQTLSQAEQAIGKDYTLHSQVFYHFLGL